MTFPIFEQSDFDVFTIPGLEPRMSALIEHVRPKLTAIGDSIAPSLSLLCGETMYPHVAKHARRKTNAPDDTWVAWAHNKRGYKAYPHYQVGMFASHLFIQFAIIYESPNKLIFADRFRSKHKMLTKQVPDHYFWSSDHMKPEVTIHQTMKKADFIQLSDKLKQIKKAEVMCGLRIDRTDPLLLDGGKLEQTIVSTFEQLLPLYQLAR